MPATHFAGGAISVASIPLSPVATDSAPTNAFELGHPWSLRTIRCIRAMAQISLTLTDIANNEESSALLQSGKIRSTLYTFLYADAV